MRDFIRGEDIGEGSFGVVFSAISKVDGRRYAVKEVELKRMSKKERREAVEEVSVMARVNHPFMVRYIQAEVESSRLLIVMEYAGGGVLQEYCRGDPLPLPSALRYFVQICLAVKHLHDRDILHRDLKSGNVFLTSDNVVKLGDFGVAKILENQYADTVAGTPHYISPEILKGVRYEMPSDIWSLGVLLYELLSGRVPFRCKSISDLTNKILNKEPRRLSSDVPRELRDLVKHMLKKNPADRPSIDDILDEEVMQVAFAEYLTPAEKAYFDYDFNCVREDYNPLADHDQIRGVEKIAPAILEGGDSSRKASKGNSSGKSARKSRTKKNKSSRQRSSRPSSRRHAAYSSHSGSRSGSRSHSHSHSQSRSHSHSRSGSFIEAPPSPAPSALLSQSASVSAVGGGGGMRGLLAWQPASASVSYDRRGYRSAAAGYPAYGRSGSFAGSSRGSYVGGGGGGYRLPPPQRASFSGGYGGYPPPSNYGGGRPRYSYY